MHRLEIYETKTVLIRDERAVISYIKKSYICIVSYFISQFFILSVDQRQHHRSRQFIPEFTCQLSQHKWLFSREFPETVPGIYA